MKVVPCVSQLLLLSFLLTADTTLAVPPPRFFPLDPGKEWVYSEESNPEARIFVVQVEGIEDDAYVVNFGGTKVRLKGLPDELDIEVDDRGFLPYYRFQEESFQHFDIFECNSDRTLVRVSMGDTVVTPAGTFENCLRYEYRGGICADAGTSVEWWKLEVGRVKWSEDSFIGPRVHTLLSYTGQPAEPDEFVRGDADASGKTDLSDAVHALGFLFLGGEKPACADAADSNDDGKIDIGDPIMLLGYLFLGSAPPPTPGPSQCGEDPTTDELTDCAAGPCAAI